MITRIKLDFYDIEKFGYYKYGEENPECGSCSEILNNLKVWTNGLDIAKTNVFANSDANSAIKHAYCAAILDNPRNGSFLLNLWNEIPNDKGKIMSLNSSDTVGNGTINTTNVPAGSIPGVPTYFWFLPSKKLFACVKLDDAIFSGKNEMEKYILGFMLFHSKYVNEIDESSESDYEKHKFVFSQNGENIKLYPKFKSKLAVSKTNTEYLINNVEKIRGIIRKECVSLRNHEKLSLINRIAQFMQLQELQESDSKIRYKFEYDYSPTLEEIKNIIEHSQSFDFNNEDMGFKLRNDKIIWLSNSVCKTEDVLDVDYRNQMPVLQSLYEAREQNRENFLAKVNRSNE